MSLPPMRLEGQAHIHLGTLLLRVMLEQLAPLARLLLPLAPPGPLVRLLLPLAPLGPLVRLQLSLAPLAPRGLQGLLVLIQRLLALQALQAQLALAQPYPFRMRERCSHLVLAVLILLALE